MERVHTTETSSFEMKRKNERRKKKKNNSDGDIKSLAFEQLSL